MKPLAKNIKRYFSLKDVLIVFIALVVSVFVSVNVFYAQKKDVRIVEDNKVFVMKTMKNTVKEVLEQKGVELDVNDYISLPLNTSLQRIKENEIFIKKAVPIYVTVDGKEHEIRTHRDTVKEALADNISLLNFSDKDKLEGAKLEDKINSAMKFKIVRVREELISEKTSIPYKTISRQNNHLDKGSQRVVKEGKKGVSEKKYRVVYEDGKQKVKELLKESVVLAPVNKIIEVGTVLNFKTSRGEVVRYKKELNMRATAYTASYADTGKRPGHPQFGITYTGIKAKKGVIAVDPKVIPLGSRVYIKGVGGTPDYGFAVAADIGSAIKGDKIDLYFEDSKSVNNWGIKKVKVYVLAN